MFLHASWKSFRRSKNRNKTENKNICGDTNAIIGSVELMATKVEIKKYVIYFLLGASGPFIDFIILSFIKACDTIIR